PFTSLYGNEVVPIFVNPAGAGNPGCTVRIAPGTRPAPAGPCGPIGPTAPVAPVGPAGPCGPIGPTAPAGPVAPVWPGSPCGPGGPCNAVPVPSWPLASMKTGLPLLLSTPFIPAIKVAVSLA